MARNNIDVKQHKRHGSSSSAPACMLWLNGAKQRGEQRQTCHGINIKPHQNNIALAQ